MASVTVKGPKKAPKRKVTHIRVGRGSNGFSVHHELEPQKRTPGSLGMYEPDPKPAYFNDKQAMLDHVGGLADQMGGDEPGAPEPG